jgi:hypothetical protein
MSRISTMLECLFPKKRAETYAIENRVRRPTPLFLEDDKRIPYEELWLSAIRCKIVHGGDGHVHDLWRMTNAFVPENLVDDIYIKELRGVSYPVSIHTYDKRDDIRIQFWMWYINHNVFLTVQMDNESEARFLRTPMRLYPLFGGVCVNRMLYRRLLSVIRELVCRLDVLKDRANTLVVSGYSAGATMAQVSAAILARMFPQMYVKCHAFGGMKPGNDAFASWSSHCIRENYRVVNGDDPVVFLPFDYRWCHIANVTLHFEKHLFVNVFYKDLPWYKRVFMRRRILRRALRGMEDHPFDMYINQLWSYTRMATYLYSVSEADDPNHTPI